MNLGPGAARRQEKGFGGPRGIFPKVMVLANDAARELLAVVA